MYLQNSYSEQYKKSLIGKLPSWAWMLIYGLLSIGGNFFLNQLTFNLLPLQFASSNGSSEMGNPIWLHFVMAPFSVLMFEIVLVIYGQFVQMLGKYSLSFSRKDFSGTFRAFYCFVLIASGLLQIMCYYNSLTIVWYRVFGVTIPRLCMMLCFFFYMKKKYLNETNTHTGLKAIFIPYMIYEIASLVVLAV